MPMQLILFLSLNIQYFGITEPEDLDCMRFNWFHLSASNGRLRIKTKTTCRGHLRHLHPHCKREMSLSLGILPGPIWLWSLCILPRHRNSRRKRLRKYRSGWLIQPWPDSGWYSFVNNVTFSSFILLIFCLSVRLRLQSDVWKKTNLSGDWNLFGNFVLLNVW